jgi:hypothetical protein
MWQGAGDWAINAGLTLALMPPIALPASTRLGNVNGVSGTDCGCNRVGWLIFVVGAGVLQRAGWGERPDQTQPLQLRKQRQRSRISGSSAKLATDEALLE